MLLSTRCSRAAVHKANDAVQQVVHGPRRGSGPDSEHLPRLGKDRGGGGARRSSPQDSNSYSALARENKHKPLLMRWDGRHMERHRVAVKLLGRQAVAAGPGWPVVASLHPFPPLPCGIADAGEQDYRAHSFCQPITGKRRSCPGSMLTSLTPMRTHMHHPRTPPRVQGSPSVGPSRPPVRARYPEGSLP